MPTFSHSHQILSIDCGTSYFKAALINEEGHFLWQYRNHYYKMPVTKLAKAKKWNTEIWLKCFQDVFYQLKTNNPLYFNNIDAVVISGQGPSPVLLKKGYKSNRKTVHRVLHWLHNTEQSTRKTQSYYLSHIQAFSLANNNEFKEIEKILPCAEYLSWVLCGQEYFFSTGTAFNEFVWTEEEIGKHNLPQSIFPQWIQTGKALGRVDTRGSEFSGLKQGIPIIAGATDFYCSLVGSGVIYEGHCCNRAGSSESFNLCRKTRISSAKTQLIPHARNGFFNVFHNCGLTGLLIDTIMRAHGYTDYEKMFQEILQSLQNAPVHPREFNSSSAASKLLFQLFRIRRELEYLQKEVQNFSSMRICGGQAQSRILNTLKADILNIQIEIPEVLDSELLGAAIFALQGLKVFGTLELAVKNCVRIASRIEPREGEQFNRQYSYWQRNAKKREY